MYTWHLSYGLVCKANGSDEPKVIRPDKNSDKNPSKTKVYNIKYSAYVHVTDYIKPTLWINFHWLQLLLPHSITIMQTVIKRPI